MILIVPNWPGQFDVEIDYRHGSPASLGVAIKLQRVGTA